MTISDECLNRLLLQGSQGLDQPVWRDGLTGGGRGRRKGRSRHKHNCPLVSWEDWHLILKTDVASHGTKRKKKDVVQMIKVMVTSDPWVYMDWILSSRPQRSAVVWVVGRIKMVSTGKKEERMAIFFCGSRTSSSLWRKTRSDTGRVKRGQSKLTFLPRPNLTSR